eukprot:344459_1
MKSRTVFFCFFFFFPFFSLNSNNMATQQLSETAIKTSGTATIIVSLITWLMFVGWLLSEDGGGLGDREDTVTTSYFNWHPFLMSATFFLLITPSVLAFELSTVQTLRHRSKKVHTFLHTLAFISITLGLYIILDCHLNLQPNGELFEDIHAICGYITFVLFCVTYLGGACLYGLSCGSIELRQNAKPYHKRLGTLTLFCGYATCLLGLAEIAHEHMELAQLMAGFVFLTMMGVVFTLVKFVDKSNPIAYEVTDASDHDDHTEDDLVVQP